MAAPLGATILTKTRVRNIDTHSKSIITDAGNFGYERLVLAVGAQPIRLALDGDALQVSLVSGTRIDTDIVLSAVGLRADLRIAQAAGLDTAREILVDAH